MRKILVMDQFRLRDHLRHLVSGNGPVFDKTKQPLVWIQGIASLNRILSDKNRTLMKWLVCISPASYAELADFCGMAPDDLWRTLQMLINFRLIHVKADHNLLTLVPPRGNIEIIVD